MVTKSNQFNYKDCEKIDGRMVNAFVDAHLNNENPVELDIESTWGDSAVDLTRAVKAAETVTRMELGSNAIEYFSEDGHVDCIYGDDLSRIISMHLLKDVDITVNPSNGIVYMYDESKEKFVPFNLTEALDRIANNIVTINGEITSLKSRVATIEHMLTKPANVPDNVKIAWGNINNYGDYTGSGIKTSGIYTHDPTVNVPNDQMFE
jgi:hypothetical protein